MWCISRPHALSAVQRPLPNENFKALNGTYVPIGVVILIKKNGQTLCPFVLRLISVLSTRPFRQ